MYIFKIKYLLFAVLLFFTAGIFAQKAERDYIRKGNRFFKDSIFVDAEVNYRKALEINPQSAVSMYNLGNALSQQQKFKDAMEQYTAAAKIEKNKSKLSQIYHNMGVLLQAGRDYAQAVEAYKMSLRNNPSDHETRYNLALAQKMLKNQQQQQNQNQDKDQNKKQDQKEEKQHDQKKDDKKDQQPPKSEKKENEMSKENAEQLLNSVMQDEKNVQDKVKKQQRVIQSEHLEKDW